MRDFREWATHRREEATHGREEAPHRREEAPQLREEALQLRESSTTHVGLGDRTTDPILGHVPPRPFKTLLLLNHLLAVGDIDAWLKILGRNLASLEIVYPLGNTV